MHTRVRPYPARAVLAALLSTLFTFVLLVSPTATASASAADLFNSAQGKFADGDARGALADIGGAVAQDPGDPNAVALQAIYADAASDLITREAALARLGAMDAGMRAGVHGLLDAVRTASFTPPNPLPAIQGPSTAIIVLGYGLLPDGSMRPELINRLQATVIQSFVSPFSPIIVTGGNPQNGITEAAAMQGWLQANGVAPQRIHAEHRAGSTVANALNSVPLARSLGAGGAIIVTSANHIRRATVDFNVARLPVVGAMSAVTSAGQLIAEVAPLTKDQQLGMYRDAIRVFGIPAGY
ncbi:YdcF family protein [Rhodococcus sp. USK13]|uniref:YdcF family protein n=1 Tax=Rhodococcus sp. USK13 TaxID=2806442 RepID=UPI001BCDD81E|nr:YdcF family protein [Rhodococcus sp. USK13]